MMRKQEFKTRFKISLLLSMILFTSFYLNFLIFTDNDRTNLDKIKDNNNIEDDIDFNPIETPKSSALGEHPWWNPDWPYRILVNISSDAGVDLKNYGVWVVLPYKSPEFIGKVNDTLKDIRIIEYLNNKAYEREYYILLNYSYSYDPGDGEHQGTRDDSKATIYFNTNISASASITPETDTYIYFGNMNVESTAVEQGLGFVKNGNFDYVPSGDDPTGHPEISPYSYDPVGWNWSHNVPDDIVPWGDIYADDNSDHPTDPIALGEGYWQNCLIGTPENQEKKLGTYTYKWGTNETIIPQAITDFSRGDDDYAGVLYSDPFVVPIVGHGNPSVDKLYLNLWRNIRVVGFDRKKSQGDVDGYFVRIINASGGISSNPDDHQMINDYLEIYAGISNNNPGSQVYNYTSGTQGNTLTTYYGDLEDPVIFDISEFMGMNVSIEIGMFGDEGRGNKDMAFGQVDEIYFTYDLDLSLELNEIQTQKTEITVITRDVDDRIIANAEVSLVQDGNVLKTQTTDSTGKTIFTNLNFGIYNFSVNYTFSPTNEAVVFNSSRDNYGTSDWDIYKVEQLYISFDLNLDIWTIDFEIVDWDGDPLDDGYVKVYNQKGGNMLKKLPLDNGSATFRWWNDTRYYYEVYFDNNKYTPNNILLNSSYIYRTDYVQNEKYYNHELDVASYDIGGNHFRVTERIYTKGSLTDFSTKKLINFNMTLEITDNDLDNVAIYYIDRNNKTDGNLIYQNLTYTTEQYDFISIDLRSVDNDKLKNENFEAYGILIDVQGTYTGSPIGKIKINTTEAALIYNTTALSKMHIRVIDDSDEYNPVPYVSVRITNGTNLITTLTTYENGWASHKSDIYKPFIYLIGYSYNISLRRIGSPAEFKVNSTNPPQWEPIGNVWRYNYTLNLNSIIILDFEESIPPTPPETQIEEIYDISLATWGEGVLHLTVNVTYRNLPTDAWTLVPDVGIFICSIQDWETGKIVLEKDMTPNYDSGMNIMNYSMTIDSSSLSAGTSFKQYWFIIDGEISGYQPPEPYYKNATVYAKETILSLHDSDTFNIVSQYEKEYGEIVELAVKFYNDTNNPLQSATITFKWTFSATKHFQIHPIDSDYYYLSFNTSEAFATSIYPITITASLENYSIQIVTSYLNVLERKTSLNGKVDLVYMTKRVWVEDANYFNFTYKDITYGADKIIKDLDVATYTWQRLDDNGNPIAGKDGSGTLIQNYDGIYTLDFNTQIKPVGSYSLYINLQKQNYELRAAIINLEIQLREFDVELDATNLENDQSTVVKGEKVKFEVRLLDTTQGNIPLRGAKVVLEIGDKEYEFDEDEPGIYTYTFSTEEIDAFFTSQTLTGQITIEKANFTSDEIDITIVVTMEEIFPGMPTLYFIMLIAVIAGMVGSLASYRIIQQARIPKHVKKIRLVKKKIKTRDTIPSISIPTKEQMIMKQFSGAWKDLDLSLEDTLGIKEKKGKEPLKLQGGEQ
ncbi:MAG: hypothetical protein ACFFHV_04935 [Promethearchaeota archaeon]